MKAKKKSGFWTFIFSFMPGAAEMYMGLMKMGVSLLTLFMLLVAVATFLNVGPVLFLAVVVWFYAFFHARNLASLDEEELQSVQDEFLFLKEDVFEGKKLFVNYRKWIAALLILSGIAMLWNELDWMLQELMIFCGLDAGTAWDYVCTIPQIAVAIVIIIAGVALIRGKKKELEG